MNERAAQSLRSEVDPLLLGLGLGELLLSVGEGLLLGLAVHGAEATRRSGRRPDPQPSRAVRVRLLLAPLAAHAAKEAPDVTGVLDAISTQDVSIARRAARVFS